MFTDSDRAFLDRLDVRAESTLAHVDDPRVRLRVALEALRAMLPGREQRSAASLEAQVEGLLDDVWWATSTNDAALARSAAGRLARAVRDLGLDGLGALRATSTALEIRTLVVLTG